MRTFLSAVGAALVLVSVAGCIGSGVVKTPVPTPSATPVFASDEEALAAAEAAYAAYTKVEDTIAQDGGQDPTRLGPLVTSDWLDHEVAAFEELRAIGHRQVGSTNVVDSQFQRLSAIEGGAEIVLYVCVDFSSISFVDASGAQIPRAGPMNATLEATFEATEPDRLLLSRIEPWPSSVC